MILEFIKGICGDQTCSIWTDTNTFLKYAKESDLEKLERYTYIFLCLKFKDFLNNMDKYPFISLLYEKSFYKVYNMSNIYIGHKLGDGVWKISTPDETIYCTMR